MAAAQRKAKSEKAPPPSGKHRDPEKEKFTYEEIVSGDISHLNEEMKEAYLEEDEFKAMMGMSMKKFYAEPKFKQRKLKQQYNLA